MNTTTSTDKKNYVLSLIILGILFFIFGFVTWLNGTIIPFLQTACELSPFEASLVTFAFYISYFVMALPSSFILKKTGYKKGMSIGLFIMSLGALIFIPAAYTRLYGVFLTGLFILATGLSLLQTAVNPFITILGPRESAAARISIMGICNKLAGFISPLILFALIMNGMERFSEDRLKILPYEQKDQLLNELASRIVGPYAVMALILFLLGLIFLMIPFARKIDFKEEDTTSMKEFFRQIPQVLKFPQLTLGVLAIFLYVGVEVMAGDSLTQFGKALHLEYAGQLTSFTMAFMVIGYILGIILIPKYLSQEKALVISSVLGFIFAVLATITSIYDNSIFSTCFGWINMLPWVNVPLIPDSVFFVTLLGLANAIMWPAIWPLALHDVEKYAKIASALLIMGIAGGAIIPPLYAKLGQNFGFQNALWIMTPIYVYLFYYALKGHTLRKD
ncbi:MAG: sugar MFS transporter [Bacteroidales bacterium]